MKNNILDRFCKSLQKNEIVPPGKIVADMNVQTFEYDGRVCRYVLDHLPPAAGMYVCEGLDGYKRFSIKTDSICDEDDLEQKFKFMKKLLKDAPEIQVDAASISCSSVPTDTDELAIDRLALLTTFEYDRIRKHEASRLKIRVSCLDKAVEKARKTRGPERLSTNYGQLKFDL